MIHELHDKIPTYENHAYHNSKALVAIQGIYGININFPENRVTCRFQYHLHSFYCMLPYLAGFGPNCYTKFVTMYFEKLYNFERKHPEMYTTYLEHGDTVRRSDRLWGWLSLNLCTGHGMMRIIKSAGGLSHCEGVDELQRAIFLLSTYMTGTMCKYKNWQGWIWNHQINTIMHFCQCLLGTKMVCWKASAT